MSGSLIILRAGPGLAVLEALRTDPGGAAGTGPRPYAWKTGTSSGQRDAWAVGVHLPRDGERAASKGTGCNGVAIGVWVGRFAGGGDAAFVGREVAGPLLADLFREAARRGPAGASGAHGLR